MTSPLTRRLVPFILRPTCFNAVFERGPWNANPVSYSSQRLDYPVISYELGSGLIDELHLRRGPSAIVRAIAAVVVNSVQRMPVRPLAHIGKKCIKRLPALTNLDALSAVRSVPNMLHVAASSTHLRPRVVSARQVSVRRMTMRGVVMLARASTRAKPSTALRKPACVGLETLAAMRARDNNDRMFPRHGHSAVEARNFDVGKYSGVLIGELAERFQAALDQGKWA